MTEKFFAEEIFELGYTDLVSVIPPGATLMPLSKIDPSQIGKVPGIRDTSGMWVGYDWRRHEPTIDNVRGWSIFGANIGMRADRFPGIDIDSTDERLVQIIADAARAKLGPAPERIGRAPKTLLMYRTDEPFTRMRLWIKHNDQDHLVEVLGQGQQYLIHGIHPATKQPYRWNVDRFPAPSELTPITRAQAQEFLAYLEEMLVMLGIGPVEREGDGRPETRTAAGDQSSLHAPSLEALREAVALIPNSNDLFPSRKDYLTMGYAIRAACGDEIDEGEAIFAEWAARWPGNGRVPGNDPEVVRADWRRMKGPYAVGWSWIAEQARQFGFADAAVEFEAVTPAPDAQVLAAPLYSEQWLADRIVTRRGGEIRFAPEMGQFLVWDGTKWEPDAELRAEDIIKQELRIVAADLMRHGGSDKERAAAQKKAEALCSAAKATNVTQLLKSERAVAIGVESLDHDPWQLNTPGGIIDLRTGRRSPSNPDALCTRSTSVPPDFSGAAPEWKRFLAEATGGDRELEAYLQRLSGYCLTGSTREQQLTFIWGPGGNGKSVFLNAIQGILGDYAKVASMDTFTASQNDRHTTDLAMLRGARLVTASETQAGKRWDEAKVKQLTGGEAITARFMRQDNFTYRPQFKLVFVGNHKPVIRDIDKAMRRRIHLVPFTVQPAIVDLELGDKLREEWPAILAWMIEGAVMWYENGLQPPAVVAEATREYFEEEDAVGRWLQEMTERDPEAATSSQELFQSWREWAGSQGEYVGSLKRLSSALVARGYARWRDPDTRRMGFAGIKLLNRTDLGIML